MNMVQNTQQIRSRTPASSIPWPAIFMDFFFRSGGYFELFRRLRHLLYYSSLELTDTRALEHSAGRSSRTRWPSFLNGFLGTMALSHLCGFWILNVQVCALQVVHSQSQAIHATGQYGSGRRSSPREMEFSFHHIIEVTL